MAEEEQEEQEEQQEDENKRIRPRERALGQKRTQIRMLLHYGLQTLSDVFEI